MPLFLLLAGMALGQPLTSIKIGTSVDGPQFAVDGQIYTGTQHFLWPQGTTHVLTYINPVDFNTGLPIGYQQDPANFTHYFFNGWSDNLNLLGQQGQSLQVVITAMPTLTSVTAQISVTQLLQINYPNSAVQALPQNNVCTSASLANDTLGGVIYVDNVCVPFSTNLYLAAGQHTFLATAFPGFAFAGWNVDQFPGSTLASMSLTLGYGTTVQPMFVAAKRARFRTNPLGLKVVVDSAELTTPLYPPGQCSPVDQALLAPAPAGSTPLCPAEFDFLPGSVHQIGATTPQSDVNGQKWIFSSFSNGVANGGQFVADSVTTTPADVIANFVQGVLCTISSSSGSAPLTIDGRSNWPSTNFYWGAGETHTISAPSTYKDSAGRTWQFVQWSNGGAQTQTITVPSDPSYGFSVSAQYQILGQAVVTSVPQGLTFTIDGSACTTPCVLNKSNGSQAVVTIPASLSVTGGVRYDFSAWSPNVPGTTSVTLTFGSGAQTYTANYTTSVQLTMVADPVGGATFTLKPASPDGYYPQGTKVSVSIAPSSGYKFLNWDGDLAGTATNATIAMDAPHVVVARMSKIPTVPTVAVTTAAGPNPDGTVAPGSIVSIYGSNLAAAYQVGQSNPLAQTIGGVTVTVGSYLLPLLFVSPGQINAQFPSSLADGDYTLTVHVVGQPDVSGPVTARRNAPALFSLPDSSGTAWALALHQDGSLVSAASPAAKGETVTMFGTGFGPYTKAVPDGFLVSNQASYILADPIALLQNGSPANYTSAGMMLGTIGLNQIRFVVDPNSPSGQNNFLVSANGRLSNTIILPVQ